MVFLLNFVTLNMFLEKTPFISNSIQNMEKVPMEIFRAYFSSSFGAEISLGPPLQTVELLLQTFKKEFQPFAKEVGMIILP